MQGFGRIIEAIITAMGFCVTIMKNITIARKALVKVILFGSVMVFVI